MEGLTADRVFEILKRLGLTPDVEESATETGILAEAWD